MTSSKHLAVIGAGAFGGWTAWYLLKAGHKVTLIDSWGPGNSRASSGGESRLIRMVYGGNVRYTSWTAHSWELWHKWQREWNTQLLFHTGLLWMFEENDAYLEASRPGMHAVGLSLEELSTTTARQRYPQIQWDGIQKAYLEPQAGFLKARKSCQVLADAFIAAGGTYIETHANPGPVRKGEMVHLSLANGESLEADGYVFACGPWLSQLFPDLLADVLSISRQEIYYFGTPQRSADYRIDKLPSWIHFGSRTLYGVPDQDGRGFKVADDTREESCDPEYMSRIPRENWVNRSRKQLVHRFPFLEKAPLIESRVCQYSNTADGHFLLDQHPEAHNVWLIGGGSGHGFKMGPAIGEYMSGVVLGKANLYPEYSLNRSHDVVPDSHQLEQ